MNTYPPHIEEARLEALAMSIDTWAIRSRWTLSRGIERMGPCPLCGGKDRFSVNTQKNKWNCRGCNEGGSDVISLVMHMEGLKFKPALARITGREIDATAVETEEEKQERLKRIETAQAQAEKRKIADAKNSEAYRERSRKAGYAIYRTSNKDWCDPNNTLWQYLSARGISVSNLFELIQQQADTSCGLNLRMHDALAYKHQCLLDGKKQWIDLHAGPAMIAPVQRPDGTFGAVHQTWLDLNNAPGFKRNLINPYEKDKTSKPVVLPSKKVLGTKKGGAIRLYTPQNPTRLVAGEGIETTLTVMENCFEPNTAYWSLVDLGNMSGRVARDANGKIQNELPDLEDKDAFTPPEWVQELVYLGDADAKTEAEYSKTKAKLQRGCRRAMALKPDLQARLVMAERGKDFNDMVRV